MRIGIIQPNFIPWRGYFDFIDDVDLFVIYEDIQYTKNDWRNRNRLKTRNGVNWLTVPIRHKTLDQLICETEIDYSRNWPRRHIAYLKDNYASSSNLKYILSILSDAYEANHRTISELNLDLIVKICGALDIRTPLISSKDIIAEGYRTEKLISMVKALGGTTYLSGPAAQSYLENDDFLRAGITLEYKSYDYEPYPQLWGGFEGAVSIIDLLLNVDMANARTLIKSRSPNRVVVEAT